MPIASYQYRKDNNNLGMRLYAYMLYRLTTNLAFYFILFYYKKRGRRFWNRQLKTLHIFLAKSMRVPHVIRLTN